MREYQLTKGNPYFLDRDIYMQMFYLIRSYPKLKESKRRILHSQSISPEVISRGSGIGNPTERKVITIEVISRQIKAIEQTIVQLNAKYNKTYTGEPFDAYEAYKDYGVFCYYRSKKTKDMAPCKKTWKRYRSEFAYILAKELGYVD